MQLAQINIGKIKGISMEDPIMDDFRNALDEINSLAEQSEGFVWRLKDDNNDATSFDPYYDKSIIINMSVWANVESLKNYTYHTMHAQFLKRRKEWFQHFEMAHMCLWWIEDGAFPSLKEAVEKLDHIRKNGPSPYAFDFKNLF